MIQYHKLVQHLLSCGTKKEVSDTEVLLSSFNYNYEVDLREGFPILQSERSEWKDIVIELLWMLSGEASCKFLEQHDCGLWRLHYSSDKTVPSACGPAWRYPGYRHSETGLTYTGPCTEGNDQIAWVLRKLADSPFSQNLAVSSWQPHIAQKTQSPCHSMFTLNVQNDDIFKIKFNVFSTEVPQPKFIGSVYATSEDIAYDEAQKTYAQPISLDRDAQWCFELACAKARRWHIGKLSGPIVPDEVRRRLCMHLTQSAAEVCSGVPHTLASYALLLSLLARFAKIEPGVLAHTLGDAYVFVRKLGEDTSGVTLLNERLELSLDPLPRLLLDESIQSIGDIENICRSNMSTDDIMKLFMLKDLV